MYIFGQILEAMHVSLSKTFPVISVNSPGYGAQRILKISQQMPASAYLLCSQNDALEVHSGGRRARE